MSLFLLNVSLTQPFMPCWHNEKMFNIWLAYFTRQVTDWKNPKRIIVLLVSSQGKFRIYQILQSLLEQNGPLPCQVSPPWPCSTVYWLDDETTNTYLLVRGPTKGLVISWTVALEANSIPTLTFSLRRRLDDWGQSLEFGGSAVLEAAVDLAVALEVKVLTLLSYKDTMLWKLSLGVCSCGVLFFRTADSSKLYR